MNPVPTWTNPPQLVVLEAMLDRARDTPEAVSDEELLARIRATYHAPWGTNCWSWVEMSLAILSAACVVRPSLAVHLLDDPIEAMIAGGLDKEEDVIPVGLWLARKAHPYVPLTEPGRAWLLDTWPTLEPDVRAIFRRKLAELTE
jgi:hypothetical protein